MLQQTQTARVLKHFNPFVARFPDARSLAAADRGGGAGAVERPGLQPARRGPAPRRGDDRGSLRRRSAERRRGSARAARRRAGHRRWRCGPSASGCRPCSWRPTSAAPSCTSSSRAATRSATANLSRCSSGALDRTDPRTWYQALMDYGAALGRSGPNPNRPPPPTTRARGSFDGSNRQQRRAHPARAGRTRAAGRRRAGLPPSAPMTRAARERARRNLQAMAAEGFLDMTGGIVALASGPREP